MKRVLSGLVLIPVVLGIVQYGSPELFALLVTAAVMAGWVEYFRMIRLTEVEVNPAVGGALCLLLVFCFYRNDFYLAWLAFATITALVSGFVLRPSITEALNRSAYTLLGVVYVAGLMGYFILLRGMEHGNHILFFLFIVIWSGDITAYYVGKSSGKRPLAPEISPGKTQEGALAGLAGSLIGGVVAKYLFFLTLPLKHCLIITLICATIGQIGDLTESLFKRRAGIKDSGSIIPGHGGVLDRLDSLMFAGPAFYIYHALIL